jgi:hypothetical protein
VILMAVPRPARVVRIDRLNRPVPTVGRCIGDVGVTGPRNAAEIAGMAQPFLCTAVRMHA